MTDDIRGAARAEIDRLIVDRDFYRRRLGGDTAAQAQWDSANRALLATPEETARAAQDPAATLATLRERLRSERLGTPRR